MGYYKDIVSKYPPLTKEEEKKMIRDYVKRKDMEGLKERLVLHNVGIIKMVAKNYHYGNFFDEDELMSYGMDGLKNAAEKFNIKTGFRFSTYAEKAIRTSLFRSIPYKRSKIDERSVSFDQKFTSDEGDESSEMMENIIEKRILDEYLPSSCKKNDSFGSEMMDLVIDLCKKNMTERKFRMFYDRYVLEMPVKAVMEKYNVSHTIVSNVIQKARKAIIVGVKGILGIKEPKWTDFEKVVEYKRNVVIDGIIREVTTNVSTGYDWKQYQMAMKEYTNTSTKRVMEFLRSNNVKK